MSSLRDGGEEGGREVGRSGSWVDGATSQHASSHVLGLRRNAEEIRARFKHVDIIYCAAQEFACVAHEKGTLYLAYLYMPFHSCLLDSIAGIALSPSLSVRKGDRRKPRGC